MLPITASPASRLRPACMARPSSRRLLLSVHSLGTEDSSRHQEALGLRLGSWKASPVVDVRRRHYGSRYRYMETLNRKFSRENGSPESTFPDCMSATSRFWRAQCTSPDGAYVNIDEIKSWSDDISGLRPSNNIGNVESKSVDDLFAASKQHSLWASFHNARKILPKRQAVLQDASIPDLHATTAKRDQDEGFIDPITNRRVYRPIATAEHQTLGKNTSVITPQEGSAQLGRDSTDFSKIKLDTEQSSDSAKLSSESGGDSSASQKPSQQGEVWGSRSFVRKRADGSNGYEYSSPPATCEEFKADDNLEKHSIGDHDSQSVKSKLDKDLDRFKKLEEYKVPYVVEDAILAAHEKKQQVFAPKAEPIAAKIEFPFEDPAKQYTDLDKYGPVYWNEPDVFRKSSRDPGNGSHYGISGPGTLSMDCRGALDPYSHNGPESHLGGQTKLKYEDPPKTRPDFEASRRTHAVHRSVASKLYTGLRRDRLQSSKESDETCSDATVRRRAVTNSTSTSQSATFRLSHKLGNPSPGVHRDSADINLDPLDSRTATEIRAHVLHRAQKDDAKAKLQKAKSDHELNWDATSEDAQKTLRQAKMSTERTLTGYYVRDFPQEFAASWSTANSPSKSTLFPKIGGDGGQSAAASHAMANMDRDEADPRSMDESFPSEDIKLEPSLDRRSTKRSVRTASYRLDAQQAEEDLFSKEPQGLETCYLKKCGDGVPQPAPVKHDKTKTSVKTTDELGEVSAEDNEQPALYRILAYDAATGSLNVADTISMTEDKRPLASPATILPRLSSPSKFLPHFAGLHEQGYEIVAGGGDVLVFRKVRAASVEASWKPIESYRVREAPVNPIDLMGKPVTGNFASPTGFVNYDAPAAPDESKPAPPFRTGRGVAAEEDCGDTRGRRRGGRRIGRKLVIGTVWVTGIAYAAGVMGEYFATGGADGLGPTGF